MKIIKRNVAVMMGGDSGINLRKVNGYWKINQIYQQIKEDAVK